MTKVTRAAFSSQELRKVEVISQVVNRELKQVRAAELLGLSTRQIRRLVKRYRDNGSIGLSCQKKNHVGRKGFDPSFKRDVMEIVRATYHDFGPTFASEKLAERHDLHINRETLRQWMIESGLRYAKPQKQARIHQSRQRRSQFGELVQIDGSPHDWFEGRAPKCCLLVFIDDATSKIQGLRFEESETTAGYFRLTKDYLLTHGRPVAYYSDKYGVFKVNNASELNPDPGTTQFHRALTELGIQLICANSPQAKGRVERANQTLQDRLVKELRLRGIRSIEEANVYLPEFIADHNRRFAVIPASAVNAHVPECLSAAELDSVLCCKETRKLSKNLEFSYKNRIYRILSKGKGYRLRHAKVTVCAIDGEVRQIIHKGHDLQFNYIEKSSKQPIVATKKEISNLLTHDSRTANRSRKPSATHPWRQYPQGSTRKENEDRVACAGR